MRQVFASAVGQEDNLGDSVLRRAFLDTLRTVGPVSVFVGAKSDGYVSGLGIQDGDTIVRDRAQWRRMVSRQVLRGDVLYAYDTGDIHIRSSDAVRYLRQTALLTVGRARGSRAAHLGVGIRSGGPWPKTVGALLRPADLVSWRDGRSRGYAGVGGVAPDWAFALGSPDDELERPRERDVLALCLRAPIEGHHRDQLDDRWFETVARVVDETGLRPVAVAQIGRDNEMTTEIAARLGGEAVLWSDDDHATHEAKVRATYARSAVAIGDRLHGLIIAATEGASPVGLTVSDPDKVQRVLEAAGYDGVFLSRRLEDAEAASVVVARAHAGRADSVRNVRESRRRLATLGEELRRRVAR